MVNLEIVRKACANDYARKKAEGGHNLEGFFKDVYEDILSGNLYTSYDTNQVVGFIKTYHLKVDNIVNEEGRVWTVFKNGEEGTSASTLEEAVYTYVSELSPIKV